MNVRDLTDDEVKDGLDLWVNAAGSQAAAWLVRTHRRVIHFSGNVEFKIPVDKKTPPWFRVAFEKLRRSPKWKTQRYESKGFRHYIIFWLERGRYSRR